MRKVNNERFTKIQETARFAWQIMSPALTQFNCVKNLYSH